MERVFSQDGGEHAIDQVRVGIDIGGTFTDAVLIDSDSAIHVAKTPSTPRAPEEGFSDALGDVVINAAITPQALGYLVHGTTVATNAVIQRRLARVGLLTTRGFGDTLEIGTQQRADLYDLSVPRAEPLVPSERRIELDERVSPEGEVRLALAEAEVVQAAATLERLKVQAVAVCFLFSFANPVHERRVREILAEHLPEIPISLSCDVAPEIREYLRVSTTVLNAALQPLVGKYVGALAARLSDDRISTPLHLMQSNGGVTTADVAGELPIGLLASGPAAGAIGGGKLGESVGEPNVLTFDMGGTTADVALVVDGTPQLRFRGEAIDHPVNLPQIDVLSVGAGGGSIASVDEWGSLSVGPRSAGSNPGPAAYGQGGDHATVTDAHLVLGTLAPDRFLGGQMPLDIEAARHAITNSVARPLSMEVEAAAAAVIALANAEMVRALHVISVGRGQDPRDFALVALGGAGALHACAIAEELAIQTVLVPRYPGLASALGLLLSDIRHDLRRSWTPSMGSEEGGLASSLHRLGADGAEHLTTAGVSARHRRIDYALDMRYRGQAFELTVPIDNAADLASAQEAFHEAHRKIYGHSSPERETEIVTLRAQAIGQVPSIRWRETLERADMNPGSRAVWMSGGFVEHLVVQRDGLEAGSLLEGPAIVEQDDSTILVPPGWRLETASAGTAILKQRESTQ